METIIKMMVVRTTVASRLSSPLHLPHTHSHLPASLDATLLRSNLIPFASYSIILLSTTFSLTPMPDSYSISNPSLMKAQKVQMLDFQELVLRTPLPPKGVLGLYGEPIGPTFARAKSPVRHSHLDLRFSPSR